VTLATQTDGFSGSEIEEVVVSAFYTTFSNETALDTAALGVEIVATKPLSVTMREKIQKIQKMRDWAKERAVRAN